MLLWYNDDLYMWSHLILLTKFSYGIYDLYNNWKAENVFKNIFCVQM